MVRIETAQPLAGYRLKVRFNDGLEGICPVESERRGDVFLKLLEAKTFNDITINPDFGCVEWPGGIDGSFLPPSANLVHSQEATPTTSCE